MSTTYGICSLSLAQGRAEARDASELVTQLLHGQCYEVLEEEEKWLRIKLADDGYECWLDRKQHSPTDEANFKASTSKSRVTDAYVSYDLEGERFSILGGSLTSEALDPQPLQNVEALAKQYLNAPYLWGGKSILGIDCSGFTQVIYSMMGKLLPRDAWQQAEQGETVSFVEEAATGDLAFFDNAEGRITHVGIVLQRDGLPQIIHASGKVRIDRLDHEGIYNTDTESYSHKLRIIKRYF